MQTIKKIDYETMYKYINHYKQFSNENRNYEIILEVENIAWKPVFNEFGRRESTNIKKIKGILNKLTSENVDILVKEMQILNYADVEIVQIIFNKMISETFYSNVYADFCEQLKDIHQILLDLCNKEFNANKSKNLCHFLGSIYKKGILRETDLNIYILQLENIESEEWIQYIEYLCVLLRSSGKSENNYLTNIYNTYKTNNKVPKRIIFLIMDTIGL